MVLMSVRERDGANMIKKLFSTNFVFILLALLAMSSLPKVALGSSGLRSSFVACAATGLSGQQPFWIKCDGSCETLECKPGESIDSKGVYHYCGCGDEGEDPVESPCCHLVVREGWFSYYLDVRGICTTAEGCAEVDGLVCKLAASQPVCQQP